MLIYGTSENSLLDNIAALEELDNIDMEEWDDAELHIPFWTSEQSCKAIVNVLDYGAVGDGAADDTQAFINAWSIACSAQNAVFLIPKDHRYLVSAMRLKGPCSDELVIQIDGTIVAPSEPSTWDAKNPRNWLTFSNLKGVLFQGRGVIDGSGTNWWKNSCKRNKTLPCKAAPTALTISSSSAINVKGLTIQNSQQMHFVISESNAVRVLGVQVSAPRDSPNTDGIHISGSTNVVVLDSIIGTGDDCISIVNASSNIMVKRVLCGPGHGISIGSLGNNNTVGIVTRVAVDTVVLRNTTNGLRIKTYQGGSGHVSSVRYKNVRMQEVANPIIIDQFYCDNPTPCANQTSAVKISKISYENISGTTTSKLAMKFACSEAVPCSKIMLRNIILESQDGEVETYCHSATGLGSGVVRPSADCLSQDKYQLGNLVPTN